MPGSSCSVVDEANDLKPRSVKLLRYNAVLLVDALRGRRSSAGSVAA
jgi:hypothetical protein